MLSDLLSMLQSRFRSGLLQLSTLFSPPLASDVLGCSLLARRVTVDVQVSEPVDQDVATMFLRQHKRKKKLAEILWESPPAHCPYVDCSALPGCVTNFSGFGFCVVVAVGVSVNLGKAPALIGSSYAGLCKRRRPRRF